MTVVRVRRAPLGRRRAPQRGPAAHQSEDLPYALPKESLRGAQTATGLPWSAVIPQPMGLNHMYKPILARFEGKTVPRIGKTQVAKSWALAAAAVMKTQGAPILLPKTPVVLLARSFFPSASPDIDSPLKGVLDALEDVLGRPHPQARLVKRKAGLVPECWNDRYVVVLTIEKRVDATNPRLELTVAAYSAGIFDRMAALLAGHALPLVPVPAPTLAQLS